MRRAELSGSDAPVQAWFAGRQLGPWSAQWGARKGAARRTAARSAAAPPAAARPAADPTEALRSLAELHDRGIVTDEEFGRLKARVGH